MPSAFESLGLSSRLLAVIDELGLAAPTPIQSAGLPVLLAGRDLIGQAQTGSGKTAAFAWPLLDGLEGLESGKPALQALVICPTRELCAQVAREVRKFGRSHAGLRVLELVGGQPAGRQRDALLRGVHVVIGTPGRLLAHHRKGCLDTSSLRFVVLDEADRMLDMGFEPDVSRLLQALPAARQTALFSATFPDAIESLSRVHQRDAVRVTIEAAQDDAPEIQQLQFTVPNDDKVNALCWVLQRTPHESALVFCNFKATVAELTRTLGAAGLSVDRLDGDLEQFERDQVLARFRNQSLRLLIATDVAGRGLDVEGLDLVVNYELPPEPEDYLHRIGRTGRAGRPGVAISLTSGPRDARRAAIEAWTGQPLESLSRTADDRRDRAALLQALVGQPRMDTLLLSCGRRDRVRAGDVLGALTGAAGGLQAAEVGRIEVREQVTYVGVSRRVSRAAVERLCAGRIKGKRFRATVLGAAGAAATTRRESRQDRSRQGERGRGGR